MTLIRPILWIASHLLVAEEGKVLRYLETESGEVNFLEEIVFIPEVGKILTLTENGTHLLVSSEEEHSLPIPLHRCNEMPNWCVECNSPVNAYILNCDSFFGS